MIKIIKLAVFDLDGTLLNTIDDIADSCNHALSTYGYPTHSVDEIKQLVGYGVRNLISKALPESERLNCDKVEDMFNCYQAHYDTNKRNKTKIYNGVLEMLNKLKENGIKIAILSNKLDKDTKDVVSYYLPNIAELVLGQRDEVPIKPDPTALFEIMDIFDVSSNETAYIGDSEADVETSHRAKVREISVTWGFRSKEQLVSAGSTLNVDNCEDLYQELVR